MMTRPPTCEEVEREYIGRVPGARATKPDRTKRPKKAGKAGPKARGRKPERWPVRRVADACSAAPVVYLALEEMARERGSRVVTPTRAALTERTGIRRVATISRALTALVDARWIRRELVPVSVGSRTAARLLRIVVIPVSSA